MNAEQESAVRNSKGSLLIVAGAGTGKTLTLVEKIKYLISKKLAKPDQILALTFTEKAALEMEERVDQALPYGYFQTWISTFHSFADQILRNEAASIGLNPGYKIITEAESVIFLRNNLFLFNLKYFRPLGNPNKFIEALLDHFSRLKDENVSTQEYILWSQKQKRKKSIPKEEREKISELAMVYQAYQKLKIKEGYLDFSDLIFYLVLLFKKRGSVLNKYRNQFKYVLVDEFQDTNIAQYELLKLLCPPGSNPNLTVVGDDSQAIYKFRGASVSNILNFMKDYKNAHQVTLNKNYRSNQIILDVAYKLIKHNDPDTLESQLGISKNLISSIKQKVAGDGVDLYIAENASEEADYVAKTILKLKKKGAYEFSDFAVLTRANNHAEPFIRAFIHKGIPYQFLGPGMLFKQPEVKDLIAYLNVLADLQDSVSSYRVLTMDIFDIDKKDLHSLISFAKRISASLLDALEIYLGLTYAEVYDADHEIYRNYAPKLTKDTNAKLLSFFTMLKRHLKLARKETAGQILYFFLEDTRYLNKLASFKTDHEEKVTLNISKFFQKLKNYEEDHEDASVFNVVDYIKMSMELGESPYASETDIREYDGVNILTVHSAKGLEWPVVFMVNLTKDRFPTRERKEKIPIPPELIKETLPVGDHHMLEERRLFYVGQTRTKDKLYFTAAKFYAEGKRERKLSNFVFEALGEEFIQKNSASKKELNSFSILDYKKKKDAKLIKKGFRANTFSYSQIETYLTCPLQYKYRYVLRIPTTPSSTASFGISVHSALEKFYTDYLRNRKVGKDRLIELYNNSWMPIGYSSKMHEKRMKKEGEKMLSSYFDKFHNSKIKTLDIERPFKIKIDKELFITGKIDRVDDKHGEIEIIDYKTGKRPEDKELEKNLQLTIYLIAAKDKGLYGKGVGKITLTFYYLRNMERVSFKKTDEDIGKVGETVRKVVSQIKNEEFLPNVGPHCDFCPFRMICEAWQ